MITLSQHTEFQTYQGCWYRMYKVIINFIVFYFVKDCIISSVNLHPNGRKLLIHTRDSITRMLDLRRFVLWLVFGSYKIRYYIWLILLSFLYAKWRSLIGCLVLPGKFLAWFEGPKKGWDLCVFLERLRKWNCFRT